MRIPRAVARFNKHVTNPLQSLWAPKLPPWAVVEHVGRKSGAQYSNPVLAWVQDGRLSIVLTYGPDTDWVRNVRAAGTFSLVRRSKRLKVGDIQVISWDSPEVAKGARLAARGFGLVLSGRLIPE